MREARFIKQNKERWQQMQLSNDEDPDHTAKCFIELVEDLGYSKTFYPNSKITQYLNSEASKQYLAIYKTKKQSVNRFWQLLKLDIPLLMAKHQRLFAISFLLFAVFITIGFFSASKDESFVRGILGDAYVDMTEKNISEGHPFGVYGNGNEILSFLGIFVNNIRVALYEFAGGILLGIPTVYILIYNSIMVGAFEQMFFSQGLGTESLLTIMIHGTIELSTFVVSATSGLVLARSWLFPGNQTRLGALKKGAKEGLVIAMSNFPMLLLAAFFEGFLTRYAEMPTWLKLLIIGFSFMLVVGYFVAYPILLIRKRKSVELQNRVAVHE